MTRGDGRRNGGDRVELEFAALTPDRWPLFARLFGERGACGGCWCMLWRQTRKEFEANKGDGNRRAMRALVKSGVEPGLLALRHTGDGSEPTAEPVGWCAIAPRDDYPTLSRSRILKPVDDRPVWSVSCLFIHRSARRQGVATALLRAAADHARRKGARILEGYPQEPKKDPMPAAFAWTGIASSFLRAGFTEVARRSPTRPIMRLEL